MKSIGCNAFSFCDSLKTINIPQSIEYVGSYAFSNCKSLGNIQLPNKTFNIQVDAFVETAYYNNKSNWLGNCLYIGKHLVSVDKNGSGEIEVREGTLSFTMSIFNVDGEYTKLYIPSSVEQISYICPYFESIEVSEANNYFSSSDGILFDKQKTKLIAFPAKKNLSTYTVPNSVKEISQEAFINATLLQKIILPNGLKKIGDGAFSVSGLISISIPESVKILPEDVFKNCVKLESITIPPSIAEIKTGAFCECLSLRTVSLPDGIQYIASGLFSDSGLTRISIPSNVKFLSNGAFEGCKQLESINIPDGIKYISDGCFNGCESLGKMKFPATIEFIGNYAFQDCYFLNEIFLPESVEKIGSYAFYGCHNLKRVTVPERVRFIDDYSLGFMRSKNENEDEFAKISDFTLICYKYSAAYDYAVQNDINYSIID